LDLLKVAIHLTKYERIPVLPKHLSVHQIRDTKQRQIESRLTAGWGSRVK